MLEVRKEYKLMCSGESSDGTYTEYWEKHGSGDGQTAFYNEKLRNSKAEIRIFVREVIETEWVRTVADGACTGAGYAHKAHGNCEGYATDRT